MRIGFDWPIDRSLAAVAGKFSATPELVWQELGFWGAAGDWRRGH